MVGQIDGAQAAPHAFRFRDLENPNCHTAALGKFVEFCEHKPFVTGP